MPRGRGGGQKGQARGQQQAVVWGDYTIRPPTPSTLTGVNPVHSCNTAPLGCDFAPAPSPLVIRLHASMKNPGSNWTVC
jgi:hypothetical protein